MLAIKKPDEFVGSQCVYYTFRIFTVMQILIGLADLITGILICAKSGSADWYDLCYLVTGLIIFVLSMFSHTTYSSPLRLICYLSWLFACFCSQLGFSLGIILVSEYSDFVGTEYAESAQWFMLAASVVLLCGFLFGSWYLSTVRDAIAEKENFKLLNKG